MVPWYGPLVQSPLKNLRAHTKGPEENPWRRVNPRGGHLQDKSRACCPNVPLLRALWSLLDGIWGLLKDSWGGPGYCKPSIPRPKTIFWIHALLACKKEVTLPRQTQPAADACWPGLCRLVRGQSRLRSGRTYAGCCGGRLGSLGPQNQGFWESPLWLHGL